MIGNEAVGAVVASATAAAIALGVCLVIARPVVLDLVKVGRRSVSTAFAEGN